MKTLTGNLETLNKEGLKQMSDVAQAQFLISAIGGGGTNAQALLGAAETKLRKLFPHHNEPSKQWTFRRLRAWWNNETDIVRHWQMLELYKAAAAAKEERELLDAARREHAAFIQKTTALAQMLEHSDEAFFGEQIEALRHQARGVDRAGNRGD